MTGADSSEELYRASCYNPACDEIVEWPPGTRESYCSWECAVEAREGLHAR